MKLIHLTALTLREINVTNNYASDYSLLINDRGTISLLTFRGNRIRDLRHVLILRFKLELCPMAIHVNLEPIPKCTLNIEMMLINIIIILVP